MDHLPKPIDHTSIDRVHFYAPLSKHAVYYPQDFFTLPSEYGYKNFQEFCENGFDKDMPVAKANEFLQSWLWFSLLAQVVGINVHIHDFRREDDTLNSNKLKSIISEWRKGEQEALDGPQSHRYMQTSNYVRALIAIDIARRFITNHCAHERMDRDDRSQTEEGQMQDDSGCPYLNCSVKRGLDTKLTLSLAILGETLQLERPTLPSGLDGREQFHYDLLVQERNWGNSTYCRKLWRANGWCPFEIRRMEATFVGVSIAYLACRVKPPIPDLDHSKCSIWECTAQRPVQTTLHMDGCDESCKTDRMEEAQLVDAIKQEKTPLVMLTDAERMEHIFVDLKKTEVLFVALTHSWEDGVVENGKDARGKNDRSMRRCQIKKAQEVANQLLKDENPDGSKKVYLWIDVLCFPREASTRATAINQMKDIYSKASAVLVWDRTLLNTPTSKFPIEMNMKIRMSNWAQRLWTLQEAVLAKRKGLHVQFQDGPVGGALLREARDAAKDDITHQYHYVWKAGHPFSSAVWKLRQGLADKAVARAWEAVQFRSSTAPQDETLVLANVLKLNVVKLEKIGAELEPAEKIASKRMIKFLEMLDEKRGLGIPSGIIFLAPPKLTAEGFGWAPKTWLTKQAHSYPLMRPLRETGTIMKKGLLVEFPGIVLHCPQAQLTDSVFWVPVQQSLNVWYKVRADRGSKGRDFADFWENHVCKYSEPSIIMTNANLRERWEVGVLVQTLGSLSNGDIRWVRTLCRVWIRLETNSNKHVELGDDFRMKPQTMLFGERLESQKWCIDGKSS